MILGDKIQSQELTGAKFAAAGAAAAAAGAGINGTQELVILGDKN